MRRIPTLRSAAVLAGLVAATVLIVAPLYAQQATTSPAGAAGPTSPDVSVNERGTVELHVQGADIRQVLQMLSKQSRTNIIATKEITGTVTADLYGVTFADALDAILKSAGFGYRRKGNFIYVYTAAQLEKIQEAERPLAVKVFRLNYITAKDASELIKTALSKDGSVSVTPPAAVGIPSSGDDAGGNALGNKDVLVVRDYPENLQTITSILRELDVRPPQVLIEATILQATLNENNALGIDFNALAGIDFRSLSSASTGLTSIAPGAVPANELDSANATFRTDLNASLDPGGLTIGFISNQVAFFIRALEEVTDTVVLANPKLLVVNKQRGEVMVGRRDGYLTTTFTETEATQTVEFLETGTQLRVRPYVTSDGYVRLEIHPEDSDGGVDATGLPSETTTEATSNVLVKDGHTIVIGGLFRERTVNSRGQVPWFGNVPVLGNVFRRRSEQTNRQELIILVTPHIIKVPADEITSEQYKDEANRIRIGMRQGMMWFGRDRLAHTHMRWARQHLAAGDIQKALWDVNMALSLQPRLEEAMRMKERLTNQALWAQESRVSSAGYIIQRMIMQELGQPVEKVAIPRKPRDGMLLDKKIRDALGVGPRPELPLDLPATTTRPAGSGNAKTPENR